MHRHLWVAGLVKKKICDRHESFLDFYHVKEFTKLYLFTDENKTKPEKLHQTGYNQLDYSGPK